MTAHPKTISQTEVQTDDPQQWLLSAIRLLGLIVLTLHLAAFRLPEDLSWSLWPYTLLSPGVGWTLALLSGALVIPNVTEFVAQWLHEGWQWLPGNRYPRRWFASLALLSGLLFWLARLRHLRWGDSYLLSIALSYPDLELRVIYNWQAPFTVFLHQRLWQFVANPLLGWPVETVYATVSILCGMVFVYLLLVFTARLGRTTLESAILAGLMLTTGAMQLFFGYVENYTILAVGLLVTLFLAWRALRGELQPLWPVLAFSLTNGFHP
jgi:hypothetical protein